MRVNINFLDFTYLYATLNQSINHLQSINHPFQLVIIQYVPLMFNAITVLIFSIQLQLHKIRSSKAAFIQLYFQCELIVNSYSSRIFQFHRLKPSLIYL